MKTARFILRSLWHYRKSNLLLFLGVFISTTVLTGALVTGDSVQYSLERLAKVRLGKIRHTLSSSVYFRDDLARQTALGGNCLVSAVISTRGLAISNTRQTRINQVRIYGIDSSFASFWDKPLLPSENGAVISASVAARLHVQPGDELLLKVMAPVKGPSGAPFTAELKPSAAITVTVSAIASDEGMGQFNLQPSQVAPFNIFISKKVLSRLLKHPNRSNLLLTDSRTDLAPTIQSLWKPEDAGWKINLKDEQYELTAEQLFIPTEVVSILEKHAVHSASYLSWLVNEISAGTASTPYSFVVATNEKFSGSPVRQGEIIINSWLAEDLKARNGDRVKLKFYSMKMGRILKEDSATFRINKILPMDEKVWDQTLMPAFPGISDAVNCRDWESGTYIDLKKIRRKDEDYWKQYKGTPKACILLEDGLKIWKNPFGECTSFRFSKKENDTAVLKNQLTKGIAPAFAGMKFNSVYEEGQLAAKNSTDFGGLFIGLGFFIIAAGILLSAMLYSLQLSVRHREIKLLSYLGFSSRMTFRIFFLEGLLILLLAGTSGAFGGVFYTKLIIRGLQTIWMPATGTTSLVLHLRWTLIILGAITGILISSLVLWQVQRKSFSSGKAFGRKGITPSLRNYSAKTLVVRHLMLHKMRHLGITGLLALGCFTILVTGLNRRENMKYQGRQTGTGGFLLQAEATLSLPQDIASRSSAYGMDPAEDSVFKSVRLVPVRQLLQSDASCLNLNRVANPTLAGIPVQEFIGRFTFIDAPPNQEPWKFLQNELSPGIIPGYIDETVLQWGLGRKTGDTIFYLDDKGTRVGIRISGTLKNSIFQGKILISDSLLLKYFPSSRQDLLLIDAGPGKEEQLTLKMENLFSDYGLNVIPAVTVLAAFDAVQNTYLSVFLLLGGLGMLIGTAGLCIFFVSDLNRRRKEIAFYHAIGFSDQLIFGIFSSGYFLLLISGITAGCLLSLLTIFLFSLHPVFDLTALIFIMIVFLIGISGIALPVLVFMRRIFPRQLQLE